MKNPGPPPRRQIFRQQAIERFTQASASGLPDGTWRPVPWLYTSALVAAGIAAWLFFM